MRKELLIFLIYVSFEDMLCMLLFMNVYRSVKPRADYHEQIQSNVHNYL